MFFVYVQDLNNVYLLQRLFYFGHRTEEEKGPINNGMIVFLDVWLQMVFGIASEGSVDYNSSHYA